MRVNRTARQLSLRYDDGGDNNNIIQGGPKLLLNDKKKETISDGPTINFTDSEKQSNTLLIQFIQKILLS